MFSDKEKISKYGSIEAYNKFMAEKYLKDTDYIIIKMQEYAMLDKTVDNDYTEILQKREEAREFLMNLEV